MANTNRSYKWCAIIYPESLPDNWETLLEGTFVPCAVSPLHQPSSEEGENKLHYHLILDFDTLKSYNQVKEITQDLLHGTIPKIVLSPKGLYDYLIHKNNPEKEQFPQGIEAITHMNGFDYDEFTKLTETDQDRIYIEILDTIDSEMFYEFAEVLKYVREFSPEWIRPIRKNAYFFTSYLRSKRELYKTWKTKQGHR